MNDYCVYVHTNLINGKIYILESQTILKDDGEIMV